MTTRNLLACAISAAIATAACAADNGETLETIFIKTQRGYSADATETNRDYSAFAATVGTKIPATPREIPQSISIITSQQIKDRNVETLDQLARKTPGLRVLSNDDGRSSIYARGYEYDEYNVNGLPAQMQSINGTLPNLAAFDRVEIMRGPSGLFDSSGEMGGLVNLVRKRPGEDFDASASAGYGTEKQYKLGGDITGKLNADGTIRGRVLAETTGKSPKPAKKTTTTKPPTPRSTGTSPPTPPQASATFTNSGTSRRITACPPGKTANCCRCHKKPSPAPTGTTLTCKATTSSPTLTTTLSTAPTAKSACATATATPNPTTPSPVAP